jgi:hypothetical protein
MRFTPKKFASRIPGYSAVLVNAKRSWGVACVLAGGLAWCRLEAARATRRTFATGLVPVAALGENPKAAEGPTVRLAHGWPA